MRWSFHLAHVAGIDVKVHRTFFLLLAWFGFIFYRHGGSAAAIDGMVDRLSGLKENVIIGKLIPARSEIEVPKREHYAELDVPESLLLEEEAELERRLAESEAGAYSGRGIATAVLDDDDFGALPIEEEEEDPIIGGAGAGE